MHNKVVYRMARGLRRSGSVVLRFNFRGVNLSEGKHDNGRGEVDDAWAALTFLRERYPALPFSIAGFSFGSRVTLRLGCAIPGPTPGTADRGRVSDFDGASRLPRGVRSAEVFCPEHA